MNSILKTLIAVGILTSFNPGARAENAASAVPALNNQEELTHEEQEAASGMPSFQAEVDRLKELKPKQLAEEQKAIYEAMRKMTPQQREEMREEMLEELEKMSAEERQSLNDQRQSEAEKLRVQELAEHGGELPRTSNSNTSKQSAASRKSASDKARHANKHKASSRADTAIPPSTQ